jgi:NAD(P)-dependent dehydrogenase (short-subunit alcohol dehydrogenase family)
MTNNLNSAIVTGSSRGIGREIATALGRLGFNVVVNYASSQAAAEQAVKEVQAAGGKAVAIQADISSAADRQRLLEHAMAAFGPIHLLVNNAGIAPLQRRDLLEADEESFDRLIGTNLKGPFFLTQACAKQMLDNVPDATGRRGNIITISSISAYTASVNRADYCIAKAGLAMMTSLFAVRLAASGINVYEIRPGIIQTDMTAGVKEKYDRLIAGGLTPLARWGQPEDVARAVIAIARGLLPFSTGEVINVDGGFHLRQL